MARTRQTLRATLSSETIVEINRRQIEKFGGGWHPTSDNFQNPGTLIHVLEEIRGSLFGKDLYPSIPEKAAILSYRIMAGHVFFDGNKRTGIAVCELFLAINGFIMKIDKDETISVAIRVADSQSMKYEDYFSWLISKTKYYSIADFLMGLRLKLLQWTGRANPPLPHEPLNL